MANHYSNREFFSFWGGKLENDELNWPNCLISCHKTDNPIGGSVDPKFSTAPLSFRILGIHYQAIIDVRYYVLSIIFSCNTFYMLPKSKKFLFTLQLISHRHEEIETSVEDQVRFCMFLHPNEWALKHFIVFHNLFMTTNQWFRWAKELFSI